MAPRSAKPAKVEDTDPFPRPTRPAGWPEVALSAWWVFIAFLMLGMSTLFWATSWPPPTGLSIVKIQLGFAVPFVVAAFGAVVALICGLVGVARAKIADPRPAATRRAVRRASVTA